MNKNILLVYAGQKIDLPRFPIAVLALASYIRKKGYNPKIVDMRIEGYSHINPDDYMCIGISSMSGEPLANALKFAKYVRSKNSKVHLIWGGVHVSLFPTQSIQNECVDVVVRGEGEQTFIELLQVLENKRSFEGILGITYKVNGNIVSNPDRSFIDVNTLDLPAYDLLDYKKYSDYYEYFGYESSRGCPHRCKFCYVIDFHKRKWRSKSPEKVIQELKEIVRLYNPKKIDFVEDNFFVDKERIRKICQGMIEAGFKFKWMSFCRADYFRRFDDEFMALLKKSGLELLSIGVESGSPTMLEKITKDITPEQVINAVKLCVRYDVMPVMSFILGIPTETKQELYETLNFYDKLYNISKKIEINGLFIYAPYPGTPIYDTALQEGYKPYTTLEGWSKWKYNDINNSPWLTKSYRNKLEIISIIARFRFFTHRLSLYSKDYRKNKIKNPIVRLAYNLAIPLYKISADIRWKLRFFSIPIEWKLLEYTRQRLFNIR